MVDTERRVLFISYNGMLDPLGQSQVLPYLREMARNQIRFTILSFERAAAFAAAGANKREQLRDELSRENIQWHALRYHQRPSVPATMYDVLAGIRHAKRLVRQNRIQLVHARSHIPATIAIPLKKISGVKMVFDVRGLMAEEYVEANHWREGALPYRLTKAMERRAFAAADGVVTLTEKVWPLIQEWDGLRGRKVSHEVIPCCVDLNVFRFNPEQRRAKREELGLGERLTLIYSGSVGGWYLTEEMADFFVQLLAKRSDAHFLWLTPGSRELIDNVMKDRGLDHTHYTVKKVPSAEMPSYLSAGDAGIAFYKPGLSKMATSPVKVTEYLACGLPVILNAGIGDSDEILSQSNVGAVISQFDNVEYSRAWDRIETARANVDHLRQRTQELARRSFDLSAVGCKRYMRLYDNVMQQS